MRAAILDGTRWQQGVQRLAANLAGRVPEYPLGGLIKEDDLLFAVHGDDRILHEVENSGQSIGRSRQPPLC